MVSRVGRAFARYRWLLEAQARVSSRFLHRTAPLNRWIAFPAVLKQNQSIQNVCWRRLASSVPDHYKVRLPALSPTMEVGKIASWEKQEGDELEEGDLLAQIETDKATMDFETPETGHLAKILIPAGTENIPLGKVLAIIVEEKGNIDAFKDFQVVEEKEEEAKAPAPSVSTTLSPPPPSPSPSPSPSVSATQQPVSGGERVFASPFAKKVASEQGVDLATVAGSGPGGRIIASDVSAATEKAPAVAAAVAGGAPTGTDVFTDTSLTNMRKVIAQRLLHSKQTIPHYYLTIEMRVDKLLKLRQQLNDSAGGQFKLSVNDFVIKASALSMRHVPEVNSSWMETFIRRHHNVDISVAVATESGLITPIVFGADGKGLEAINGDVLNLAQKARQNKLQPHEFQGGTFTISNLGMYGMKHFTAIINPPQSCILAVGAVEKKVFADSDSEGGYSVGSGMCVTMSCDHRVVDGAVGAQWLQKFKGYLEDPMTMLL